MTSKTQVAVGETYTHVDHGDVEVIKIKPHYPTVEVHQRGDDPSVIVPDVRWVVKFDAFPNSQESKFGRYRSVKLTTFVEKIT